MSGRESSPDKPRRLIEAELTESESGQGGRFVKRQSNWLRSGIGVAVVSGIAIVATAVIGTSVAGANAIAGAIDSSAVAGRGEDLSRDADRVLSVEDLANERSSLIEANSEQIQQGQETAAYQSRQAQLSSAADDVQKEAERLANLAKFAWPTDGTVGSAWGMRLHPILHYYRMHDGDDIGGKCGQPIYAAQSGTVIKAVSDGYNGGSGHNIRIEHGDINGVDVQTAYLHMEKVQVSVGDKVDKGDLLGTVGNTGLSTSCHLHFSLYKNGKGSNPQEYIGWANPAKN